MAELKHKVRCATCGKRETIKIVNREIPENWAYFGKIDVNVCKTSKYFLKPHGGRKTQNHPLGSLIKIPNSCYNPKAKHKFVEYWECRECVEKGTEGQTAHDRRNDGGLLMGAGYAESKHGVERS